MPLGFLIKTAITVVTPPVVFNSFPLPVTHLTAVEPPRDRRRVASIHFRDCTAVVLRRHGGDGGATAGHGGDGGATAVLVRCHGGHGGAAETQLRIGLTRGGTVEVLNMFNVSAVPPRRSAFLTVFGGTTANNDGTTAEPLRNHCGTTAEPLRNHCGTTAEPLRNHGDHGGATAVYVVQAPQWHRAFGVTGVVLPPRRSAVLTVFRGATAINDGTTARTTAIMTVPLRFMPYKHRSGTGPPV